MAVIKLSKSRKQFQFIDNEGNIFGTSVRTVQQLIDTHKFGRFDWVKLVRMPFSVNPDRFGKSLLWDGEKMIEDDGRNLSFGDKDKIDADGLGGKGRKKMTMQKSYKDKKVSLSRRA